jgi:hypothetical protein
MRRAQRIFPTLFSRWEEGFVLPSPAAPNPIRRRRISVLVFVRPRSPAGFADKREREREHD